MSLLDIVAWTATRAAATRIGFIKLDPITNDGVPLKLNQAAFPEV